MDAADLHVHLPVAAQPSLEALLSVVGHAETHGYDRAWMPETWGRDAVTTLAVAADRASDIALGASVLNVYSRSPALLGQTAATLAAASPGTFRLGIGPSGPALIEGWHGLSYDRPLRRTREAAEIVRAVTSGDVVTYDGEVFDIEGFRLRCDPPESPVPVDLAGLGPKAVELAGFVGDGWHALLVDPDGLEDHLEHLRRGARRADRDSADVDVTLNLLCCALEDGDRARRLAAEHIAFYAGAMGPFYHRALVRQGFDAADDVRDAWQAGDREGAIETARDALLDPLAAAGAPDETRERLAEVRSVAGVDAVAVSLPRGATPAEIEATLSALAP